MRRIGLFLAFILSTLSLSAQFESLIGGAPATKQPSTTNAPTKSGINLTDANGKKQGEWEKRDAKGILIYKATFKDDKPIGLLTRYYPNGKKKIEINYSVSNQLAPTKLFDEKENVIAEGFYKDTQKDSTWTYYDAYKHLVCIENYNNGVLDGKTTYYYLDGSVFETLLYKKGVKEGDWTQYYRSGKLKLKSQYVNDAINGSFKIFFENEKAEVVGFYKNGKEDGKWRFYTPDGKTDYDIFYKNGLIQNSAEIDAKKSERLKALEKNKNTIKDPEHYRNDPEGYMMGN